MHSAKYVSMIVGVTLAQAWSYHAQSADFTNVPVVINILKNSGVTEEAAKKAVEQASGLMKQANIKLTVVKTNVLAANDGDDGSGGGTAGDAVLTSAERRKVREAGGKEIETTDNKKGIKITFAKTPESDDPSNPGISVHRNATLIAKPNGQTIAHELGHILTLGPAHKIDGTVTADGGGHAPNVAGKSGRENLMAPSDYRTGTNLTADQMKTIVDDKFLEKVGKTVAKELKDIGGKPVGEKRPQQYGTVTDDLDDQTTLSQRFLDLFRAVLSSETVRSTIDTLLTLGGLFPENGVVKATYRMLFDTDANAATGSTRSGFTGIEKEVVVQVERMTFAGPLSVAGDVIDTATSASTALPVPPRLLTGHELFGSDKPGVPIEHQLGIDIPKSLLGLSASLIPIGLVSEDWTSSTPQISDSAMLVFDALRFARDATLTPLLLEGFAGTPMPFQVTGLAPDTPFNLFLDEFPVFSGLLDDAGAFDGSFIVPAVAPGDYFLTAQDATGEFAFNVVLIPEPPSGPLLLIAIATLLLMLGARRSAERRAFAVGNL